MGGILTEELLKSDEEEPADDQWSTTKEATIEMNVDILVT